MSATDFFDSNTLLYLLSGEAAKANRIESMISDGGTISIQILNEVAAVAYRKFRKPIPQIREFLHGIRAACALHTPSIRTHERGLDIAERYRFAIYDSMLLASALKAGCTTFYTEDLQHDQRIEGLMVRNPFRE